MAVPNAELCALHGCGSIGDEQEGIGGGGDDVPQVGVQPLPLGLPIWTVQGAVQLNGSSNLDQRLLGQHGQLAWVEGREGGKQQVEKTRVIQRSAVNTQR